MKIKSINFNFLILCLITSPYVASATETVNTYFTVGVMHITNDTLDVLKVNTSDTIDDSDYAALFTIGHNLSPSLAIEGGIMTSTEVRADISEKTNFNSPQFFGQGYYAVRNVPGTGDKVTIKAEIDPSLLLGLKYTFLKSRALTFYGKGGMMLWSVDYTVVPGTAEFAYGLPSNTYTNCGGCRQEFLSSTGNDLYIGLGMSYAISEKSSIGFDYMSSEINDSDVSSLSASLVRNF
jgi:hypothetical protein